MTSGNLYWWRNEKKKKLEVKGPLVENHCFSLVVTQPFEFEFEWRKLSKEKIIQNNALLVILCVKLRAFASGAKGANGKCFMWNT